MQDDAPMESIQFVTPSPPGFYVLTPLSREGGSIEGASRDPVIAWAIDRFGTAFPVTFDGVQFINCSILAPDGEVTDPYGTTFSSVDDWVEEQQKMDEKQRVKDWFVDFFRTEHSPTHSTDGPWSK